MKPWNGHYVDYDYSDPSYSLEMLTGIKGYTQRNVEWAKENNDYSALEYYIPKLKALVRAIENRT